MLSCGYALSRSAVFSLVRWLSLTGQIIPCFYCNVWLRNHDAVAHESSGHHTATGSDLRRNDSERLGGRVSNHQISLPDVIWLQHMILFDTMRLHLREAAPDVSFKVNKLPQRLRLPLPVNRIASACFARCGKIQAQLVTL